MKLTKKYANIHDTEPRHTRPPEVKGNLGSHFASCSQFTPKTKASKETSFSILTKIIRKY